ncbi:MAG: hypothetical protein WCA51_02670 [Dehalococcoidia bacterium]
MFNAANLLPSVILRNRSSVILRNRSSVILREPFASVIMREPFASVILREPFASVILRNKVTKDLAQDKLRDRRIWLRINSAYSTPSPGGRELEGGGLTTISPSPCPLPSREEWDSSRSLP